MAKTNAERQRDYRQRRAAGEHPGPRCPGCRVRDEEAAKARDALEAWKDEARRWGEARKPEIVLLEAELEAARDEIARLEEKLAASAAWCGTHSREKLCPACCGAADYDF